jgi:hypothetical protein
MALKGQPSSAPGAGKKKERSRREAAEPSSCRGKRCDGWLQLETMDSHEGQAFVPGFLHPLFDLPH